VGLAPRVAACPPASEPACFSPGWSLQLRLLAAPCQYQLASALESTHQVRPSLLPHETQTLTRLAPSSLQKQPLPLTPLHTSNLFLWHTLQPCRTNPNLNTQHPTPTPNTQPATSTLNPNTPPIRTLVLPKFSCHCYRHSGPTQRCRAPGDESSALPFTCTLEQVRGGGVFCLLFPVCCVLCAACCLQSAVCCPLWAVGCALLAVSCLRALCALCAVLFAVHGVVQRAGLYAVLCAVCCVLCAVCCCAVCCVLCAGLCFMESLRSSTTKTDSCCSSSNPNPSAQPQPQPRSCSSRAHCTRTCPPLTTGGSHSGSTRFWTTGARPVRGGGGCTAALPWVCLLPATLIILIIITFNQLYTPTQPPASQPLHPNPLHPNPLHPNPSPNPLTPPPPPPQPPAPQPPGWVKHARTEFAAGAPRCGAPPPALCLEVNNTRPPRRVNQQVIAPGGLDDAQVVELLKPYAKAKLLHFTQVGGGLSPRGRAWGLVDCFVCFGGWGGARPQLGGGEPAVPTAEEPLSHFSTQLRTQPQRTHPPTLNARTHPPSTHARTQTDPTPSPRSYSGASRTTSGAPNSKCGSTRCSPPGAAGGGGGGSPRTRGGWGGRGCWRGVQKREQWCWQGGLFSGARTDGGHPR